MKIKPIILSGGSGVRLWPLSRKNKPKQFVDLFQSNTNLFAQTLNRVNSLLFSQPIIVSNKDQRFDILKNIRDTKLKVDKIILEESPKNTAPACAAASYFCSDNEIMCFFPSDHYIKNDSTFLKTIKQACEIADNNKLVVLGAICKDPNQNYGYISYKKVKNNQKYFFVKKFIEKPSRIKAQKLFQEKAFWNSGIVIVKNSVLKNLLNQYTKNLLMQVNKCCINSYTENEFTLLDKTIWKKIKPISIDYAILEKSFDKIVLPLKTQWSDLGTFESLHNKSKSVGDVLNIESKNCFTFSSDKLLVTSNVKDLIIVNTNNATLVTKIGDAKTIRKIVKKLENNGREETFNDNTTQRPWGSFTNLGNGDNYKVKKLLILPGQKISLQKHLKRSEHWVIVKGTAYITKGKKSFFLKTNQSTFIKKNEIHRIENKSKSDLIMIEVQTGKYLEEDDIQRFADIYNR